jgi:hypothetical protein
MVTSAELTKSARSGERQNGVKALSEFSGLSFRACPIGYFPNHQGLDFQIGSASLLWQGLRRLLIFAAPAAVFEV